MNQKSVLNLIKILPVFLVLLLSGCTAYEFDPNEIPTRIDPVATDFYPLSLQDLGVPEQIDQHLEYSSFQIGYRFEFKQAAWSGYVLQPELVRIKIDRVDSFKEELLIPIEYRATLNDYSGSGFQRGHLAPNATLDHTEQSMADTFYLSNISPQKMTLNIFDWRALESYIRDCVDDYEDEEKVFVFTGPYFEGSLNTIGDSNIPVPTGFYKVIYEFNDNSASAFAVMAPHENFDFKNLQNHLRSIDFIENLTGLDFSAQLPEQLESDLESNISAACELPS